MAGDAATAADNGWHAKSHVADVVAAALDGRDRQNAALIEGDGVDDIANGDADGEARSGLLLNHFAPGAFGAGEQLVSQAVRPAGIFVEGQATDGGARPD